MVLVDGSEGEERRIKDVLSNLSQAVYKQWCFSLALEVGREKALA